MPDGRFTRTEILAHLDAVAESLPTLKPRPVLVVVGGSFLALRELRESTADIDTITPIVNRVREAVHGVAARFGLQPTWLNDHARAFAPVGLREEDCDVLFEHARLLVLGPPFEAVFLMKLNAHRGLDYDDMVVLWPHCSFESPDKVVDLYYTAYPHEERDPYLADYISEIMRAATDVSQ